MSRTRTGGFGIGFRRGGGSWQKDIAALANWARDHEFACVDIGPSVDDADAVVDAGLAVGTAKATFFQAVQGLRGMLARAPGTEGVEEVGT